MRGRSQNDEGGEAKSWERVTADATDRRGSPYSLLPASPAMARQNDVRERRGPHFFKVFFPCYTSKRLGIPPGFWKHIHHETSRGVSLIGPSGKVWNVDLVRDNDGGISFQNGWEHFVADHTLDTGDFLLFRYDGDLCFTVMVFDLTACEKEGAFHAKPSKGVRVLRQNCPRRRARKCSVEDSIIVDPRTDMAIPSTSRSRGGRGNTLAATCKEFAKKHTIAVESHSEELHADDGSMITTENNMDCSSEPELVLGTQIGPSTFLHDRQPEVVECIGANLSRSERIAMGNRGVHSRVAQQHSSCKECLNSSRGVHLDRVACDIKEECEDDSNACSGETLLKRKRITKRGANKSLSLCGGNFKESARKHKELAVERSTCKKKNKNVMKQPCCKHSRSSTGSKIDNVMIKARMGHAVSCRRPITESDKAKALEAAMLFQSEHPFSTCVMQESNVYYGYYMCLPSSFMKYLPKISVRMQLWSPSNKPWKVMYVHCKGQGGFSAGWGKFVRAHNLESDDVCVFELFKPDEMRVHIFRVVEEIVPLIWSDCRGKE